MISLKGLSRSQCETVLLLGSGAVQSAWEPVFDALKDRIPCRNADVANAYFASLVHKLRWLSLMAARQTSATAEYESELNHAKNEYTAVTSAIAVALRTQPLQVHPAGELVREKFLQGRDYLVVTTNWEFSAAKTFQVDHSSSTSSITYLHGTYSVGLYLPGEVVDEPHRDVNNRGEFFTSALGTVNALVSATRLVLYGISISPLDSELGFLLQWANKERDSPFDEVIVVDLDPEPVIKRLKVHLGRQHYLPVLPDELPTFLLHPSAHGR